MSTGNKPYQVGEIRPSQIIHTFGIGSIIDLPHLSVMVMGLDEWNEHACSEIGEDRLRTSVQAILGPQVKALRSPPVVNETFPNNGAPVAPFPRWMVCPSCRLLSPIDDGIFTLKQEWNRSDRTRYVHEGCRKVGQPPTVMPVRFLVACTNGHLDDFPWHFFVHKGKPCPKPGTLRLRETGVSGEATDILVECDGCGAKRSMAEAFDLAGQERMPMCRGRHPHLREFADTQCQEPTKTILLGASNSWFSQTLSVVSVPTATGQLEQLVDEMWHQLEKAQCAQNINFLRSLGGIGKLHIYSDEEIWEAVERKKTPGSAKTEPLSIKGPEWKTLIDPTNAPKLPNFDIREETPPPAYQHILERVVLVDRLREVRVLIGFTRITSPGNMTDELEDATIQAPLSRQSPTWVPATEVHGEGIFLQFREDKLAAWLEKPEVIAHDERFHQAHTAWRRARNIPEPSLHYPGLRYVLLHTFAHALIRQVALECGYATASIRERIYAFPTEHTEGPMAGVLLYTAAPDSEGTLGGLVSLGSPTELGRHLDNALEQMRWCSSDPLCAEHTPRAAPVSLHAAACHACLFAPETSCERGNRYLDRSLLVPTVDRTKHGLAFF